MWWLLEQMAHSYHSPSKIKQNDTFTITHSQSKFLHTNFNNSVRTSKKTQHFPIKKIKWLMLFKDIIPVYTESHMKPMKLNVVAEW
jgi:hypothetical protein